LSFRLNATQYRVNARDLFFSEQENVAMLNFHIFEAADAIAALVLAAGFLIAYLMDRHLAAFRWWGGFYALVALSFGTIVLHPVPNIVWVPAVSSIFLYGAVALASFGMYHEGERRTRPHRAIAAGAVLLAAIVVTLHATDAPHADWMLLGPAPTVLFILWSIQSVLREKPGASGKWGCALALLTGAILIGVRTVWFAGIASLALPSALPAPLPPLAGRPPFLAQSPPDQLAALAAPSIEQPLVLSLVTILLMVALALALVLRISLAAVGLMRVRSSTDVMTGLLNRATFDERAIAALDAAQGRTVCAIVFDIDHFKRINDTCGHAVGDRVISGLGGVIGDASENRQIAGRIGGEEFAVVLTGSTLAAARLFAEAVRTRFSACDFGSDVTWTVTLSAGVARRDGNEPLHALLARADKALYVAKNHGRNRVMLAGDAPDEALDAQLA
jgi:diguanylate cyclase (GGDEF)-like protein